jgi:hypothetical protein
MRVACNEQTTNKMRDYLEIPQNQKMHVEFMIEFRENYNILVLILFRGSQEQTYNICSIKQNTSLTEYYAAQILMEMIHY